MKNFLSLGTKIVRRSRAGYNGFIHNFFGVDYTNQSYSQFGEDMVLRSIFCRFPNEFKGFYIDVGAHHPKRFSNTYYFYLRGWRGICIDPIPNGGVLFAKQRPRDIFLGIGVSEKEGELPYYIYEEPAFNTFSEKFTNSYKFQPIKSIMVRTSPLEKILKEYLPDGVTINFLSIDAEGYDLKILSSNNWQRYRPQIILFEEDTIGVIMDITKLQGNMLLNQNNYEAIAKIPGGLIYVDKTSPVFDGSAYLNFR
jgi:FkbM family methyltransferase